MLPTPGMYEYDLQDRQWHALNLEATKYLEPTNIRSNTNRTMFEGLILLQKPYQP